MAVYKKYGHSTRDRKGLWLFVTSWGMLTPAPLRFGRRLNRVSGTKKLLSTGESSPESSDGPSALGSCWPRACEMIVDGMSRGKLW